MDWVKLNTDYYRDVAVAVGSDAAEVMFVRGMALAGELEESGFIPDVMVGYLTRKPAQATRIARELVKARLWEKVPGGYMVVNFVRINAELERLVAKKRRDRDRKRATRGQSGAASADPSEDSPTDLLLDSESKSKKAAAAASPAAAAAPLDGRIDVLRSKLQAHTPLRGLRFDSLRPDAVDQLIDLIELHGDDPLVAVAIDTCRNPAPTHASAFLGTWAALPPPGQRLHAVTQVLCDTHATPLSPAGICRGCASDQKAAR